MLEHLKATWTGFYCIVKYGLTIGCLALALAWLAILVHPCYLYVFGFLVACWFTGSVIRNI